MRSLFDFRTRVVAICVSAVGLTLACSGSSPAPTPTPVLPSSARFAQAPHGMVVSASGIASEVGRNVLAAGGNAVDAAIATGFALAVTYPTAGNIGGGGFMVIRFPDGRATAIDFREAAPSAATPEMFKDSAGQYSYQIHHESYKSVGVPGTVAGFAFAHAKYGKTSWRQLVEPAVRLASEGFAAPAGLANSLASMRDEFKAHPASLAAYTRNGQPYGTGERIVLGDLGRTLARIRDRGRAGFYEGETARLIVDDMHRNSGLITMQDLSSYEAKERAPVRGTYRGYEIISMPPPTSGGVALIEMLNILEGYDLKSLGHNSASYVHYVTEAMRRAFVDRAHYLGDPDFVDVPVQRLTSKSYAADLRRTIQRDRATMSTPTQVAQGFESNETTHYSVVDASGMAVSVTYTLEYGYGLGSVVPGAGFLLNNEMGDFNALPGRTDSTGLIGTPPNVARPGKRMLSSMTPSIVAKDGKLVGVVGSPGGRTIINTVLQVILNQVDFDMGIERAVAAPRFHHQWLPDVLSVEGNGLPASVVSALESMGYHVRMRGEQGTAHSIWFDPRSRQWQGAADPRDSDAGAAGF
ncbi:MAG TPA: gamma-glutamyltransferase [Gemmatimonadaceae bacterium]|nr:gamma-glutamyltransferase [Gemmatimonadaceae bacterium]